MRQLWFCTAAIMLVFVVKGVSVQGNEFRIVEKESFTYVYLSCQGPMEKMPAEISRFIPLFFQQGLQSTGPLLSVYFNSPAEVPEDQLRWRVGFPVYGEVAVEQPLETDRYQEKKVLEYLHEGSYDQLPDVYRRIQAYLQSNNMEYVLPTYEFYLNDPSQVAAVDLLTRIEIPIKE